MEKTHTYSIKYVSRQTGVKPYLIRSWEARYNAVCPKRSENNRRCFTDDDIRRLKLLKLAVDEGHSISVVAGMSDEELKQLLKQMVSEADETRPISDRFDENREFRIDAEQMVENALSHIVGLDAPSLEKELYDAAVQMSRQAFLQDVLVPIFQKIGVLWRTGKMKIINEHMASVVVRSILWDMLRGVEVSEDAPRIVVATPVGHWHEFGALASALAASESGWRIFYFGPNLPSEEIAYAVKRLRAKAVALSLCHTLNGNLLMSELQKLRRVVGEQSKFF